MRAKRGRAISAAKKGKPGTSNNCPPGCQCGKHTLRNSGQWGAGNPGFTGRHHSKTTRAKLASYTGPKASGYKDGRTKVPEWRNWAAMMSRCYDPRNGSFKYYGARGIRVVRRWHDFWKFLEDMGPKPGPEYQLNRKDHKHNYGPNNVSWGTR